MPTNTHTCADTQTEMLKVLTHGMEPCHLRTSDDGLSWSSYVSGDTDPPLHANLNVTEPPVVTFIALIIESSRYWLVRSGTLNMVRMMSCNPLVFILDTSLAALNSGEGFFFFLHSRQFIITWTSILKKQKLGTSTEPFMIFWFCWGFCFYLFEVRSLTVPRPQTLETDVSCYTFFIISGCKCTDGYEQPSLDTRM